jgi:hypothetical protein
MELSNKQSIAWHLLNDSTTQTVIYGGAAGGGKSYLGCLWLVSWCMKYAGVRMALGRYEYKKLKTTSYKTLLDVFKKWDMHEGEEFTLNLASDNPHVKFANGSEIVLVHFAVSHKDPDFDRLGSLELTGIFIDEVAEIQYRAWSVIMGRIRYKLDDYGLIPKRFGTCNPTNTFVKSEYYEPWKEGVLPEDIAFIEAKYTDNPHLSKTYGDAIAGMDEIDRRRYLGDWDYHEDGSNLYGVNKLKSIFYTTPIPNPKNLYYITCDVARFGSDLTVILVWEGFNVVKCEHYAKSSIPFVVERIKVLQLDYGIHSANVIVDTDGVGGAVTDSIGSDEFNNGGKTIKLGGGLRKEIPNSKSFDASRKAKSGERYVNLKAQVYHVMAYLDWTWQPEFIVKGKNGNLKIQDYIKAELRLVSSVSKASKRSITDKDKIKQMLGRSPDFADAIAMRGYFELRKLAII